MTRLTRDDVTIKFYLKAEVHDGAGNIGEIDNGNDLGSVALDFYVANDLLTALRLLGFDVPDNISFNEIRSALKEPL